MIHCEVETLLWQCMPKHRKQQTGISYRIKESWHYRSHITAKYVVEYLLLITRFEMYNLVSVVWRLHRLNWQVQCTRATCLEKQSRDRGVSRIRWHIYHYHLSITGDDGTKIPVATALFIIWKYTNTYWYDTDLIYFVYFFYKDSWSAEMFCSEILISYLNI